MFDIVLELGIHLFEHPMLFELPAVPVVVFAFAPWHSIWNVLATGKTGLHLDLFCSNDRNENLLVSGQVIDGVGKLVAGEMLKKD